MTTRLRIYFPEREVDHPEQKRDDERIVGIGTDDGKDGNIDCPVGAIPGSKPFCCLKPLSKDEIAELEVDYQDIVFCPEHLPAKNRADCVYCHTRQQQLVERATPANQKVEQIKTRGVQKVCGPLASAKQISLDRWVSPVSKKEWDVPKMVKFVGLRMEIPHPDSPLAQWRLNFRECISYTILVTCPELMTYSMNQDWTDTQCIETLDFQESHELREGTIPADVFAVAITHFTARALDEGQKASQSMEEGEHHVSQTHENVELRGLRPRLLGEDR